MIKNSVKFEYIVLIRSEIMIEFDEYKIQLEELKKSIKELGVSL